MGILTNHELSKTYQEATLAAANFTAVSRREIESVKESLSPDTPRSLRKLGKSSLQYLMW